MDDIKTKLGKAGLLIGAMGIISALLAIFNHDIRLLTWVDTWGNSTGWIIGILLIVTDGALFFLYGRTKDKV